MAIEKRKTKFSSGQSFVELALVIPVLLIMLLGVVEVSLFVGRYLDLLDLTREAARYASLRDPFTTPTGADCSAQNEFNFYYDTSCTFSPPAGSSSCSGGSDPFCNGINSTIPLNMTHDDVVIEVYTVDNTQVTDVWPKPNGYWALSDHDADLAHNGNWQYDCQGHVVNTTPYFTTAKVNSLLESNTPPKRAYVVVEAYYCYVQEMGIPLISQFIPNPMRVHAYSIMSIPAAQPSPTP